MARLEQKWNTGWETAMWKAGNGHKPALRSETADDRPREGKTDCALPRRLKSRRGRNGRIALAVLAAACLSWPAWADFKSGLKAVARQDFNTAYKELRPLAAKNHAGAQYNLGLMYQRGFGVEKEPREAFRLYGQAARNNHALAMNNLGVMYRKGESVQRDYGKALHWFRKAAGKTLVGKSNLGSMYLSGHGVEADYAEAVRWFRAAAKNGFAKSQYELGLMYEKGLGVKKSHDKALQWIRKAASQGYSGAIRWLRRGDSDTAKETAAKPEPAAAGGTSGSSGVSRCPGVPGVSWWGDVRHTKLIKYVERKHDGDWSAYSAKWEKHLTHMIELFDKQKGAAIPKDRVDLEKGEVLRAGAVTEDTVILSREDLALYIPKLVQRTAVHRCLVNEAASRRLAVPHRTANRAPSAGSEVRITRDVAHVTVATPRGPAVIKRSNRPDNTAVKRLLTAQRNCPSRCVQPHEAAESVATIGELETIQFLEMNIGYLIDVRIPALYRIGTIPGAVNLPYRLFARRLNRLGCTKGTFKWSCRHAKDIVVFCDGPGGYEASQTIRDIIRLGYPADRIKYYRGGMQSWTHLGLTVEKPH